MNLPLFVYGSMRDADVRAVVLGRIPTELRIEPASMPNVTAALVPGESYPYLVSMEGACAAGRAAPRARCDLPRSDSVLRERRVRVLECEVERAGGERVAAVHFGGIAIAQAPVVPWSLERWQAREKSRFLAMTREYMALSGRATRDHAEAVWQRLLGERHAHDHER